MARGALSEAAIREWVGEASFQRSRDYLRNDSLVNLRIQGGTLKAQCYGSSDEPYRVAATIDARGAILSASCSCPVGGGGHCKHVAAMLRTFIADPAEFTPIEELDQALARRSKEELISLIRAMLAQTPELELLLELPAAGAAERPLSAEVVRRQVAAAVRRAGDDWHAAARVAGDLQGLLTLIDSYVERRDYAAAVTAYSALAGELADQADAFEDEEGELRQVLSACVEGLGACLAVDTDLARRAAALQALFDQFRRDLEYGETGITVEVIDAVDRTATPAERTWAIAQLRSMLPGPGRRDDWGDQYRRKRLGELILKLSGSGLDEEERLRISVEAGLAVAVAEIRIGRGKPAEAMAAARNANDLDLQQIAELLWAAGHRTEARALVRERLARSPNVPLGGWLLQKAQEAGAPEELLSVAEEVFWRGPTPAGYRVLAGAAQALGRWAELRPKVIERLAKGKNQALMARIALIDQDVAAALELTPLLLDGPYADTELLLEIAQAAEAGQPDDAIWLYLQLAELLIKQQNRASYASAAQILLRAREVHRRTGRMAAWPGVIDTVRQGYKRLRALQDELKRAGL